MAHARLSHISEADYLAGEELPGPKHEYVNGQIFAMAGASKTRGTISGNVFAAIRSHLRGSPCRAWMADMKLQVAAASAYYYPDIVATCAESDLRADSPQNFVAAPKLVVEVLSPATEKVDRREKWFAYRQIDSLEEYVLVDQERQWVEVFRRHEAGWVQEIAGPGEAVALASIGLTLALEDIYEGSGITPESSPEML